MVEMVALQPFKQATLIGHRIMPGWLRSLLQEAYTVIFTNPIEIVVLSRQEQLLLYRFLD